jgi:glycosyltransferase involved in cell wall biosynthesis
MMHVDLAVDPADFPPIKSRFNVPTERRFLYIGHAAPTKNVAYLQKIARAMPHTHFGWIGGGPDAPPLNRYGPLNFRTTSARDLVAKYDFFITVGRADANPATVLEAMAWGLVPICTPSSGYFGYDSIVNIPLDDVSSAVAVLRRLQSAQEEDLSRLQQKNWQLIDEHFNWDRFAAQVVDAIEGEPAPAAERLSAIGTARLRLASYIDRETLRFRVRALRKALSSLA